MNSVHQWHLLSFVYIQVIEEGDAEVHGKEVNAGDTAEGDVRAAHGEVPTISEGPSIPFPTPPTPPPQPSHDIPSTSQGRMIAEMDQDADVFLEEAKEVAEDAKDESEPTEVQEVVYVVTTTKIITEVVTVASETITAASETITAAEAQVPAVTLTDAPARVTVAPSRRRKGVAKEDPAVKRYQVLKRKPQTEAQARKNMMVYLKNVAGFKIDYFKGMSYDDMHHIFEAKFNINVAFLQKTKEQIEEEESRAVKRLNETPAEKAAKRQKEDLEALCSLVKERFSTTKPKNFSDDFLLVTLGAMFKKLDIHSQVWKNQRSVHGPAKVKGWKLLESCGVQIITFTTTQLILFVERKYPLTRFTIDQMLNAVRLKVEEESEVSLELLRFIRQQHQEGIPSDFYSLIDNNKTAKDLWDALARHMLGSEYGEQDKKAVVLYEYETFKASEGELLLDTYIRYLQWKQYETMTRQNKNLLDINIDALYNILKQNQYDVNDAMKSKKKTVVITSDPLALVAEQTKVRKKEKVIVSSESKRSDDELRKITALLAKVFNPKKFYSKPTNNNLRTSSTTSSANKKQEYVKSDNQKKEKKVDEKKRDMRKVKCYNYKHEQVLLAEDHAWMESSSDSDQEINANMVFMAQIEKVLSDLEASSSSSNDKIVENEQIKVLIEKNDDLLAQTKVLQEQFKVKHVVIDDHVECQTKYAKLKAERYEYMIRYSAYFDNDKQHRKQIVDQEILFDKMSRQLVEFDENVRMLKNTLLKKDLKISELEECVRNKDLEIKKCLERLNECENKLHKIGQTNQTIHMIMPSKDKMYNGQKGIGYTSRFLIHSDEDLETGKFKRARDNKIEFAYDYENLNASDVNEKINFSDVYFQEIIYLDFEKIDSLFQQTSSLKSVETKLKRKSHKRTSSKHHNKQVNKDVLRADKDFVHFSDLNTLSSVRIPKPSGVMWMKKGSSNTVKADLSFVNHSNLNKNVKRYSRKNLMACNNSDTHSTFDCNNAMNALCNARMNASVDVNDLFVFDEVSIRKSHVSKMPFRKKPSASLNVHSRSKMNKSLPRGCLKHMTGNRALLMNFVEKFLGTVCFGNKDFVVIAGYGDVVIGSITIKKVYYFEGLGHNLFSVGQFCDKGLGVAFRKFICFVRTEGGVDLLTGDRSSNLYNIALNEVASNSSACLLAKASSLQSWLWHQRLSHLNFATIHNLVKNNLVYGLPKMKFEKDHLCSTCEQGKIHQKHHKSKTAFTSNQPLYILHMDLCGLMHVKSINGKRYVLVVVDDYSRHTWVQRVQTDNGTEFKSKTLTKFFDEVQRVQTDNGTEFKSKTLTKFFDEAEAIATACFTQNRSIIHKRFDKTPYEFMNKRKPNIKFFHVFGCKCYLLNDYDDVGKLKEKVDIGVFVGCSKESVAFRFYNK
nr:retrovirus-related Pol polyprotein from transposon TNT 1-94 [Tanacetum cinerariifolium]